MAFPRETFPFEGEVMPDGIASRVVADIHHFFSKERLHQAAAQSERARLACELHDGLLQQLTGAALQLDALSRMIDRDPDAVRQRLHDIEQLIVEEQRALRRWLEGERSPAAVAMTSGGELAEALHKLIKRTEWQSNLRVEFRLVGEGLLPRTLADDIYRIVQEACTNIGRHARARNARVELRQSFDHLHLDISDDGVGFPIHGRYDLAALTKRGMGPVSLRERIAFLGGEFVLTTSASGSRLEISLPLEHASRARTPGITRGWPASAA